MKPTSDASLFGNGSAPVNQTQGTFSAPTRTRSLIAATIGCMLEWYDFAIYGFFAVVISRLFFPAQSEVVSLLLSVATFGVGFAMRPIGALVFGTIADRRGRRVAMSWTVATMAIGTLMLAVAPPYTSIGIAAPIIVVLARLIQGFSAGGEMGSALSYLVEFAPEERKFLYASFQQVTQILSLLLGSFVGAVVNSFLAPSDIESWGWRLPFFLGLIIAPIGWYIRNKTEEPPAFAEILERRHDVSRAHAKTTETPSPWGTLAQYPRSTLAGFCITVLWTVATYFFLVFMPTYAVKQLHLPASTSLTSNSVSLLVAVIATPFFGALADRIGPLRLLRFGAVAISICIYPALMLLTHYPTFSTLVIVQSAFAFLISSFTAPAGGTIAKLFPDETRSIGVSIAYNFAVTLFGGFAPFIATWLIHASQNSLSPAYYVIFAGCMALIGTVLATPQVRRV